jgi:signal transduction histidine kinase
MTTTNSSQFNINADINKVSRIDAVTSILEVICRTTGMGFAAVARVTDEKWVACAVRDEIQFGLQPGGELQLETTICHEIRQSGNPVVIDHVINDEAFVNHHTPAMYGFQSYISVPIVLKNGDFFGTLCAIDPKPAQLKNPQVMGMFKLFAELIAFHLNALDQLAISESNLLEERKTAELREQFIAILGHDLRNPVGAVSSVAQMLLRMPLDERMTRLATILQDSSYRMKALIENVMDFARGRLGDGITLNRSIKKPVQETLQHVIDELSVIWAERTIETEFDLQEPVHCDGTRVAQLFSNLLGNALTHGQKDMPVKVRVTSSNGKFTLSVTNACKQIPEAIIERLFQPFSRGEVEPRQQGLGLGLYIASEIARAHGGTLTVTSTPIETTFTLQMPSQVVSDL